MKAYSTDLRARVLQALANGMKRREVVQIFQVSEGSITRWQRLQRDGRSLAGRRPPGQPPVIRSADDALIQQFVATHPDATLQEYADLWNAEHPDRPLSRWTLGRAIRRLHLTRKKRV